ncbi:MAG: hypothetical protein HQL39_10160 [Alphaproteobacteria bacterium]|nr:hypothetical protein [Alphaproteobacteria bacterium]
MSEPAAPKKKRRAKKAEAPAKPRRALLGSELNPASAAEGVAPINLKDAAADPALRKMGVELWRQMRGTPEAPPPTSVEDLWKQLPNARLNSSSTADEINRYRERLGFRATMLEALLEETLHELDLLAHAVPADAPPPEPEPEPAPEPEKPKSRKRKAA